MTNRFSLSPIGHTQMINGQFAIQLAAKHQDGLYGLEGFSHAIALWWAHAADQPAQRARLKMPSPYTASRQDVGVFATRSEARPNPIGLTVFALSLVDVEAGTLLSPYFDMLPETPVLDVKPYFPAPDRVVDARVPDHFSHWPQSLDASATFDWSNEFRA